MLIDYFSPPHIIFGYKALDSLFNSDFPLGERCLLVCGRKSMFDLGIINKIKKKFLKLRITTVVYKDIPPEPSYKFVEEGINLARKQNCDFVVGIGGGSVLDVAKAIAGLFNEKFFTVREFMYGREVKIKGIDFLAIPTTHGTGSEVSKNSVLKDEERKIKSSIRSHFFLAKMAIVDPSLTFSLPEDYTAYSGMDALTHAIESYVCLKANELTKLSAYKAIDLIFKNILIAYEEGRNKIARKNMCLASLLAGLSFSNSGLGLCHGLAHPIGVIYNLPHGLVNAMLLPHIVEFNLKENKKLYQEIINLLPRKKNSSLVKFLLKLNEKLNIPSRLSSLGINLKKEDKDKIYSSLKYSWSAKLNPRKAKKEDIISILEKIC